jgi:uncharacterized protein
VPVPALVVGFDLDLTLLDTRPGIAATYRTLRADLGIEIDIDAALSRIGIPLEEELAHWLPANEVPVGIEAYRRLYAEWGVSDFVILPGVHDALSAVRSWGGEVRVVTAKRADLARSCLAEAGLLDLVDSISGELVGVGKAAALTGAIAYVGDHPLDVDAARAAGATAVGVRTGAHAEDTLAADVVLTDLSEFPGWLADAELQRRLRWLDGRLAELAPVVVAFSGGADSAFVLAAAVRAVGASQVLAATAVSDALPATELAVAREFAAGLGVEHQTPSTRELDRDGYRRNDGDRCFFCKSELVEVLAPLAEARGARVLTGTNADDARAGFRPGIRAAQERGAVAPLLEAGLTKAQVRAASRAWGLVTWDKPAAACLSSRIAYGIEISADRLRRVERAEDALRDALTAAGAPVRNIRVRDLGSGARVEVDADLVNLLVDRPGLLDGVREAGFDNVEVDQLGFRSGAMNALLANPDRFR